MSAKVANTWKTSWDARCDTCYSLGRTLTRLKDHSLLEAVCPLYQFSMYSMVCWECEAMINNIKKFQKKVLQAMSLKSQAAKGIYKRTSGLSILKTTDVEILSITPVNPQTENKENNNGEHKSNEEYYSNEEHKSNNEEHYSKNLDDVKVELDYCDDPLESSVFVYENDVLGDATVAESLNDNDQLIVTTVEELNLSSDGEESQNSQENEKRCLKVYKCEECPEYYPSLSELENHEKKHSKPACLACTICRQQFENSKKRREHHRSAHPNIRMKKNRSLTSAEKTRRYRERLKLNPEKLEMMRKKNLERVKLKKKRISELTPEEAEVRREQWRIYKKNQRNKTTKSKKNDL